MATYDRKIEAIQKIIMDNFPDDMDLDECAKVVIAAAIDAGIPLSELEKAINAEQGVSS